MAYFIPGNLFEGRLGPQEMPTPTIDTLCDVAEPLLVNGFVLSNSTASSQTATVYIVADGDTAAADNQLLPEVTVPPNDVVSYFFDQGIPVALGDTIQHVASGVGINITMVASRRNR